MSIFRQIDFGNMVEGQSKELRFEFDPNIVKSIRELQPSCGCTMPTIHMDAGEIRVAYTAKSVPVHLTGQGGYKAHHTILVTYVGADGAIYSDTIIFTGTILKRR